MLTVSKMLASKAIIASSIMVSDNRLCENEFVAP
jgi:hypothetical protein